MTKFSRLRCIGCNQPLNWGDDRWVSDDNGETGCPACFTEDGSGECWNRHLIAQGMEARQGGDAEGGSVHDSPAPEGVRP